MGAAAERTDWPALADRLDALAADLMRAADAAPASAPAEYDHERELDAQAVRLWSLSLVHYAIQIRQTMGG